MNERMWVNPRQPQTLYLAQILMYFRGGLALLFLLLTRTSVELLGSSAIYTGFILLDSVGQIVAGNGIANENKWGYQLGLVVAFAPLVVSGIVLFEGGIGDVNVIGLMFDIALVALLLHPMSVEYRRVWFR
jgi:hypothetical protein